MRPSTTLEEVDKAQLSTSWGFASSFYVKVSLTISLTRPPMTLFTSPQNLYPPLQSPALEESNIWHSI